MQRLMTSLRATTARLWRADAPLTALGLLMLAVLAGSAVGLWLDPRTITGAPAWLKPAKFAASIAIYSLSLAWVFTYLPAWTRTRRVVSRATVATLLLEIVIISLQAWRGTTSHFNVGTVLDGALFTIMGLAIVVGTGAGAAVAVALWRERFRDRTTGWALRLGLTMTLIGAATGGLMTRPTAAQLAAAQTARLTVAGAHTVGAPDGGPGLPGTGWSRDHGDLRVPHFLGLHALQAFALLALALSRTGWSETRRVRLLLAGAASYIALFGILLWQALRGESVVAPDATTVLVLVVWAALTAAAPWLVDGRRKPADVVAAAY
jgi:hypothetical protein